MKGSLFEEVRRKFRAITHKLIERKLTVTAMESCTGGQIASLLTDTEGSSEVFKGSLVTYSNEAKIRHGVSEETIRTYGVYSEQTAKAMAHACRSEFSSDIGLGITGSFGNADPANEDSIPGEAWFAIETNAGVQCFRCSIPVQKDRLSYKMYMADAVADKLADLIGR